MFDYILKVPLAKVVLILLSIATLLGLIYYYLTCDDKTAAIVGGIVAGFIVAIIQLLMDWHSYEASEKLKKLKIKEALVARNDRVYYGEFIALAEDSIDIMGVTGERFMKDFVDHDPNAPAASKIIIEKMRQGINVRILMPKSDYLDSESVAKADEAKPLFERIKSEYPNTFNVRYFSHIPAHSIFRVDNECIIGPVFPRLASRYTPAIRFYNESPVVKKYITYFNSEWDSADELQ